MLLQLAFLLCQKPSTSRMLLILFTVAVIINTAGYLFELQADNMETALNAVKILYLGKPYVTLTMMFFVLHNCRIKYPRWLAPVLFVFHTFIALSVYTCEYHSLYYTSYGFSEEGLFPHLVLGHGIVFYLYIILMTIYFLGMTYCCIRKYLLAKHRNEKKYILTLTLAIMIVFASLIVYLFGLTGGYDITGASYIICSIMLLCSSIGFNFFDTLDLAKETILDSIEDGVCVFDNSDKLLYLNSRAGRMLGTVDSNNSEELIEKFNEYVKNKTVFENEGKIYTAIKNPIVNNGHAAGTLYVLEDVTDSYSYGKRLEHDVTEKTKQIELIQQHFFDSFATLVEARDGMTGKHIKHTSSYVSAICRELKARGVYDEQLTDEFIKTVIEAAPLHDIGKIAIADAILQKPGKLTSDEFEVIKTHAAIGADILADIIKDAGETPTLKMAEEMAHYHHERWDGSGYPCGLKGDEIPLGARIMALADVYDALLSKRTYKEAFSVTEALAIIREGAGTHFDPRITEVFLDIANTFDID